MNQDELDINAYLNYGCSFCELDIQEQIKVWR